MIVLSRSRKAAGRPLGGLGRGLGRGLDRRLGSGAPVGAPDAGTASDGRLLFVSLGTLGPPVHFIVQHVGLTPGDHGYGEGRRGPATPPSLVAGPGSSPPSPDPWSPWLSPLARGSALSGLADA